MASPHRLPGSGLVATWQVAALKLGQYHSCAIKLEGTVACWGRNLNGELGDGTTTARPLAVSVTGVSDAMALAGGEHHTCALKADRTLACWGWNGHGQLGDGTGDNRMAPVAIPNLTDVAAVEAGAIFTCALKTNGSTACAGYNGYGQLGDGSTTTPRYGFVMGTAGAAFWR
ncbi:RCC1 domain-containing protein [Variovorax sp. RO1]|uniref:RCC1 domain-containing protein n=1 Tax=Variovorax sp. RO1 TaxID=2066034 RepID=UPI0021514DB0|nr:hypothetical protein [Variovorax sp. RO1]